MKMERMSLTLLFALLDLSFAWIVLPSSSLLSPSPIRRCSRVAWPLYEATSSSESSSNVKDKLDFSTSFTVDPNHPNDNNAMAFLRKMGRVGGNKDFRYGVGVDEGPSGKTMKGRVRAI
jgi:hypothetical protein